MSLIDQPSCDVCGSLCDTCITVYEREEQKPFDICSDCLELSTADLLPEPTDEEVRWG